MREQSRGREKEREKERKGKRSLTPIDSAECKLVGDAGGRRSRRRLE